MKRTDIKHPNNDCKVWSQLERWQIELIERLKIESGKTESEIVRRLLVKPLRDYRESRNEILSKVNDELKESAQKTLGLL